MTDSNTRAAVITMLDARLADSIDLALITKQAHWTVKGPQFIAIHEMLDALRGAVDAYVDTLAERVSTLGGTPHGTVQAVAQRTGLPPYPTDISAIPDHLRALVSRVAAASEAMRRDIDSAANAGDAATADVFTEVTRGLDKWRWFLESHLQG